MSVLIKVWLSWLLFCIGDIVSQPMQRNWVDSERAVSFLYRVYDELMWASVKLQGNDSRGPWG